jgi:uncharacterized protein (TIGR03790 family)
MNPTRRVAILLAAILTTPVLPLHAQSAENVAIVINDLSPDSQRIGEHYARTRGLPTANVLRIQTSLDDAVERSAYVTTIEQPIARTIRRAGLQDRILYLVLTKGIPLRIIGNTGLDGTQASVDSELALLYRRLTGQIVETAGPLDNPFFLGMRDIKEAQPFTHREHDIYLVTRLDAFTAADAIALIDRAQTPRTDGHIVLDQRAAGTTSQTGDEWMERTAERLAAQGQGSRVTLEKTAKSARMADAVLGRYAWGAVDPEQQTRRTGMTFVPGAIAANLASFDARTFRPPPETWQPSSSTDRASWFEGASDGLIGDLIREGVTGASGQVGEALIRGAVRPDILFPAYFAGFTLAEAFYLATPVLSWQTVLVGDPLTAPFATRRLTSDIEEAVDPATGLPGLFSRRRVAVVAAANRDAPQNAVTAVVRAGHLLDIDDTAGARRAFAEAVAAAPRNANWLLSLATLEEQAGNFESTVRVYQDLLTIQPASVIALNNAAFTLAVHLGKPLEALPLAKRAAALAPNVGSVIDTLAWTEHLLGNDDAAAKLLEQAIALEPKHPEIRLRLAIVSAALNMWPQAEDHLKEALRLDPQLESRDDVHKLRARLSKQHE